MVYTVCVALLTLMLQKLWNVGVQGVTFVAQLGSRTEADEEEKSGETSEGEISAEDLDSSFAKRPIMQTLNHKLMPPPPPPKEISIPALAHHPQAIPLMLHDQFKDEINQQRVQVKRL